MPEDREWLEAQIAKCEECATDKPFLCELHSEAAEALDF